MQIGWVDELSPLLTCDITDNYLDGVGDDTHSWAYDGFRNVKWNGEYESYGPSNEGSPVWKIGDTLGCHFTQHASNSEFEISFSLNGVNFGAAYHIRSNKNINTKYYPAISLAEEQSIVINIGQIPFSYFPRGNKYEYQPVISSLSETHRNTVISDESLIIQHKVPPQDVTTSDSENVKIVDFSNEIIENFCLEDEKYNSVNAIFSLGQELVKAELARRGLKVGGTPAERAERLFAVRGLDENDIPQKLKKK
jgi:hypothetical protein